MLLAIFEKDCPDLTFLEPSLRIHGHLNISFLRAFLVHFLQHVVQSSFLQHVVKSSITVLGAYLRILEKLFFTDAFSFSRMSGKRLLAILLCFFCVSLLNF